MRSFLIMLILFVSMFFCVSFKESKVNEDFDLKMTADYHSSLIKDIDTAQKSIHCVMYLINFNKNRKNDPALAILDSLIKAKKRGLKVTVVVDHNKKYWARKDEKEKIESKSEEALAYLSQAGVSVFLDSEDDITHSKVVIIDEKISYIGSSNWTYSALKRNHETNIKINNKALAHELQQQLSEIKVRAYDKTVK